MEFDDHRMTCWAGCNWPHFNWAVDHGAWIILVPMLIWVMFFTKAKGR
jgi:hypothetical protein